MRPMAILLTGLLLAVPGGAICGGGQHSAECVRDQSWMSYTVTHPLHTFDATSHDVSYDVKLDSAGTGITGVEATVDVTTFDSGNSNRDSHAMEVVDALTYPSASFRSTEISRAGDSLTVNGDLTFHGVTKPVVATGTCRLAGGVMTVSEQFNLSMTAFGLERPSLLLMPVQDTVRFSLMAVFNVR